MGNFSYQLSDAYLVLNKRNCDTLHLGTGSGLYCLINIGDNNHDGKDEIAFVVDNCDFSSLNSCNIYTICRNKWTELKSFGVNEFAFDYTTNEEPVFNEIPGFLEKHNGQWMFKDYYQEFFDTIEGNTKFAKLKLYKCK